MITARYVVALLVLVMVYFMKGSILTALKLLLHFQRPLLALLPDSVHAAGRANTQ